MRVFKTDQINISLLFFALLLAAICTDAQPVATANEAEVPVLKKAGSRGFGCRAEGNLIIADAQKFKEIAADPKCRLLAMMDVDLTKQTLIGFHAGGDCFIEASARVFRNETEKKYTVRVKNIWGGCRAAGTFQGWLLIEKIPPNFRVEFTETRIDGLNRNSEDAGISAFPVTENQKIETRSFDVKDCIQTYPEREFIIRDQKSFLGAIRNDMSREPCLKKLEKIDFEKHTLLGIELHTGYCRVPLFRLIEAVKNDEQKQYVIEIEYIEPVAPCRALDQYDLWLLVPKLPENYTVKFDVKGIPRSDK